ncbi:MAG: 4-(cytidine 5'-diphospho)-2-C-methyl-D-erythritol kinase [Desulfuromonas sp.]|nr:4-(cytidine 5'-diphospho)-2-C-methyl-D-erythritol kinase [Desulfuromonas sp.]
MKIIAPAKVNLCLHVTAKRSDGYHDLCMIMQKISLCDELDIEVTASAGVEFSCANIELGSPEDNLVVRAAQALLRYDKHQRGLKISLKKNIPVAAGLGGGSSDAASTLVAVDKLLGLNLDPEVLRREALSLGADVPFFLYGSVAWATGIGDKLQAVNIVPPYWLVLVNPGVGVSTAQVYSTLSEQGYSSSPIYPVIKTEAELLALLHNDLEAATLPLCPQVAQLKDDMLRLGAKGTLMSGSGPTVFGVFFSEEMAHCAQQKLIEEGRGWSCVASPV